MEKNNIHWSALSDAAILQQIGQYIKTIRLQQNKTQLQIAEDSGVNRSTIMLLEKGNGANLHSFISVLRSLRQLHLLEAFSAGQKVSPLLLAKLQQKQRQRATKTIKG